MYQRKYNELSEKRICGIVAEYNPLHKGHEFLLNTVRKETASDYVIVIMSGDFVQRGAPAICNKYARTKMALHAGADLVIELPARYALSSAPDFAFGAVRSLDSLNCISRLCFGSECGDTGTLYEIASKISNRSSNENKSLKDNLKKGLSYALSFSDSLVLNESENDILTCPNNLLGIEYIKELIKSGSDIKPFTIKRSGSGYNDLNPDSALHYASAKAIREYILNKKSDYEGYVPKYVCEMLKDEHIVSTDMFSDVLFYKLLCEAHKGYTDYLDVSEELSGKIIKYLPKYTSVSEFILLLKSKNLTYSRISRCLFHILLNIKKDQEKSIEYIRILGFRKSSEELLHIIKHNSSLPLITKLADAQKTDLLKQDIFCASVYEQVTKNNINEYISGPVMI